MERARSKDLETAIFFKGNGGLRREPHRALRCNSSPPGRLRGFRINPYPDRVPIDFMFQMTYAELGDWISRFVMSNNKRWATEIAECVTERSNYVVHSKHICVSDRSGNLFLPSIRHKKIATDSAAPLPGQRPKYCNFIFILSSFHLYSMLKIPTFAL